MKLNSILEIFPHKTAFAHCDIPCGVYDPNRMQNAAHTVIRMTSLLKDEKDTHKISRMAHVKEKHGKIVEEELITLAYDYFKNEHYDKYENLEELIDEAVELSAKARQNIDFESANKLLEKVLEISIIFYKSKGLESARVKSPYPTELDIVVQK